MITRSTPLIAVAFVAATVAGVRGWDHPGHMLAADIAFFEIERIRPQLIEKIGAILLAHPDTAPFWVAAGEAKGKERVRRMFIECARWPDDVKFTAADRPTWHSARWAIVATDAPPAARAAAAARQGRTAGQGIEALTLFAGMLANPETSPSERATAMCWVLHIMGDIHQPMHVSDLFSSDFPAGNAGATMSYVEDPITSKPIPLHVLWDSNALRVPTVEAVDPHVQAFETKYPRSSLTELKTHPAGAPDAFRVWAQESHQIAVDWAYELRTVSDPNKDVDANRLVQNMVRYILDGIAPVDNAPKLPDGYWERLRNAAERRITLAGYRIADLLIGAADQIEAQTKFAGR